MSRKPFQFKQFAILQDRTAMKVGTDGVLLGAWVHGKKTGKALDIGTGTGLISLMLAQRFPELMIDAIELDLDAYHQAIENKVNSSFNNRIELHHTAIQEYETTKIYDLIVSNPPFFTVNDRVELDARKQARQEQSLSFEELLQKTAQLLHKDGAACFIIPFDREGEFTITASLKGLFPCRITHVRGTVSTPVKRSLLQFTFTPCAEPVQNQLIIEEARHQYTHDYIALTKEFYLKM